MAKLTRPFRPSTVNEKLVDRFIRHSIFLARLEAGEAKEISSFLDKQVFPELYDKLIAKLSKTNLSNKRFAVKRLNEMLTSVDRQISVGMAKAGKLSAARLKDFSKWEAEWALKTVQKTVPLDISMTMPSATLLRSLVLNTPMSGHRMETWFGKLSGAVKRDLNKQLRKGIAAGEAIPAIGKRIQGIVKKTRKQSEFIARTAVSNVVNRARNEVYKANESLISGWQFVATLDTRTTMVCINYDGQVYKIGDGPVPPVHFNCRSTSVPITKAWQELGIEPPPPGTRASMNGAVPDRVTYKDWLKGQSPAVQEKVLGKTRARLYQQGRDLGTFISKDLKPIPISDLLDAEGLASLPEPQRLLVKRWRRLKRKYRETGDLKFIAKQGALEKEMRELGLTPKDWEPSTTRKPTVPKPTVPKPTVPKPTVPAPEPQAGPTKFKTAKEYREYLVKTVEEQKMQITIVSEVQERKAEVGRYWELWAKEKDHSLRQDYGIKARRAERDLAKLKKQINFTTADQRKLLSESDNMVGQVRILKNYKLDKKRAKKWQAVADDLLSWVPKNREYTQQFKELALEKVSTNQFAGQYTLSRYLPVIHMSSDAPRVMAHEFGHHLSYQLKGFDANQTRFFYKRTAGEKWTRIRYGRFEGKKDKWSRYSEYAGRRYSDGRVPEVASVGVEHIWNNPYTAAKKDPEWFDMIISQLKGIPES